MGKRIFQDDSDIENPPKRLCEDLTMRKIHDIMSERQGGSGNEVTDGAAE